MPGPVDAIPDDAVLVHIGPHKTGTSSIQSTLARMRPTLRDHGVVYPGRPKQLHHADEVRALRNFAAGWDRDPEKVPDEKRWTDLVAKVRATPGRVVISSEFLAQADETARRRLVDDFGRERVHVVTAARNPAALAVSTWQQVLRKGYPVTLEQWLERFYRRDEPVERPDEFWAWADPLALSGVWADLVGPDHVTVVVLDERDRRLLASTFEQLLGVPGGLIADREAPDPNRGFSAAEATLLREVIARLGSDLSWAEYSQVMRAGLMRRLMEVRKPGPEEPRTALPAWAAAQAGVEAERMVARLPTSGVRVVGRVESLRVVPGAAADAAPVTHVPVDLAADAVVGAISGALARNWRLEGRTREPAGTAMHAKSEPTKSAPTKPAPTTSASEKPKTVRPAAAKAAPARGKLAAELPTRELVRMVASRAKQRLRRGSS